MLTNDFIDAFRNVNPIIFIEGWKRIDEAPYEGGCTDFALTVLYTIEGSWWKVLWSILTFKAKFYYALSSTNRASKKKFLGIIPMKWVPRHTVLWYRGKGYIDSSHSTWREDPAPHKTIWPWPFPWVYFRILWGAIVNFLF